MNKTEFVDWIVSEKGYSVKSARDAASRLRRILNITGEESATKKTIAIAEKKEEFTTASLSIRSQMKKSVRLALEYENQDQ